MISMLKVVKSPYWPQTNFVNPHFPHGCSRKLNNYIQYKDMVFIPKKDEKLVTLTTGKVIPLGRDRNALKQAKKACINMKNLTTIVRNSLDEKLAVNV